MKNTEIERMQRWYGQYRRSNLTEIVGDKRGCAYKRCSSDKIRSWYFIQNNLLNAKILSATCQFFTAAGFRKEKGVDYFVVDTGRTVREIPLSELE